MRRFGGVNWLWIVFAAMALIVGASLLTSTDSASLAAKRFMKALGEGDTETLTALSAFTPPRPREEVKRDWEKSTRLSKGYLFLYNVKSESSPAPDRATVKLEVVRNGLSKGAYEENFALAMVKVEGKWKVDVRSISREMYPALPR